MCIKILLRQIVPLQLRVLLLLLIRQQSLRPKLKIYHQFRHATLRHTQLPTCSHKQQPHVMLVLDIVRWVNSHLSLYFWFLFFLFYYKTFKSTFTGLSPDGKTADSVESACAASCPASTSTNKVSCSLVADTNKVLGCNVGVYYQSVGTSTIKPSICAETTAAYCQVNSFCFQNWKIIFWFINIKHQII